MASISAEQVSPVKTAIVILDRPSDWDEWLFLVERKARSHGIWQYIDPSAPDTPHLIAVELEDPLTIDDLIYKLNDERAGPIRV